MNGLDSLRGERSYVEVGVALTPSAPSAIPGAAAGARVCQVQLQPGGRIVEARQVNLGQGVGKGVFLPIAPGEEVLVLFPGGDPNRALVLGGLGNGRNPNPSDNLGAAALVMHPGGVELRDAPEVPANGIVHGQFLVELAAYLTQLDALIGSLAGAANIGAVVSAAAAFCSNTGTVPGTPSTFTQAVLTSAGTNGSGVGTAPHATLLHKVTP